MSKNESKITLCLGGFVFIKEKNNRKKTKTFGYVRAKNTENGGYEIVTVMSSIDNSTVNAVLADIEAIPITAVKQALYEVECSFPFAEYNAFASHYNAFQYKLVTIPLLVADTDINA